jgi:hypothetical protein
MVTASLCLQAALFGAFGILSAIFHYRASRAGVLAKNLKTVLVVMYISAAIVTIRCIYRLVEYLMGWDSPIYTNEVYFYVFDAAIMLANTLLLNAFHPGKRLPASNSVFLARDGVTERRGPGWADDRPWLVTVVDPFDVWGLVRGKDKSKQFWDMSDEELEAARLRKKASKRGILKGLLDPLRLWGREGYVGRYFVKDRRQALEGHGGAFESGKRKDQGRVGTEAV